MSDAPSSNPSNELQHGYWMPNGLQHTDLAQKALDIAEVILIALDPNGNVLFLNRRGHEILEYPNESLIGKNWYESCLPERDREKVASALHHLADEGRDPIGHFENWIRTKSGKELLIAWYNTVLTDENGRCVGTLSSGEDITERRETEEAIRREKAFSDAIIDSLPGPFYVLNERGRYVRWNKVQEELIGLPPEKIPTIPSLSTIHKDDRREMTRKTAEVFREGHASLEARHRKTGRYLCYIGKRMDLGDAKFLVGMGIDITDRKQAEETLRESEQRFRGVVETSPDAIAVMEPNGRMLMVNQQAARMSGCDSVQECLALYDRFSNLVAPEDQARAATEVRKAIIRGGPSTFELTLRRRDGSLWPAEVRSSVVRDHEGKPTLLIAVARDITERKRTEQILRDSEERFRGVVETSPDAIAVMDLRGRLLMVNRQAASLTGFVSVEASLRQYHQFNDVVATKDQARAAREIRKLIVRGEPRTFELDLIRHDGSCWPGEVRCSLLRDREGRPASIITVTRDITERRQAELTLRESEERFRGVVETSPDAITVMDLHGRILMANRQSARLNGYDSTEEFMSCTKGFYDVVVPEDRARAVSAVRRVLVRGGSHTFEISLARRDGSRWPGEVRGSALRDSQGLPTGVITVARDITERKLAEQRQATSLRRLESVNRLQEDLLLPESLDEKFKRITEAAISLLDLDFCRIWVVEPGDLCNAGCIHAAAADTHQVACHRERCLHLLASAGRYTNIDGRRRRVPLGCCKIGRIAIDKERRFLTNEVTTDPHVADHQWARDLGLVSFAGYKLHDTNGDPIGVLAVFAKHPLSEEDDAFLLNLSEITSRVILDSQARQELQETRRQAIAASEAKSEFLANMSHEIRTPMTAILGFTDLLMSQNLTSEEQHEFLETIGRNGRSLLVLINDILDLSKIEAAKISVESMSYSLRQLVDDVMEVVQVRAQEKGLSLQVLYEAALPETIRTDPTRLRQILVNLMGNAIKFTESGGVQLSIRRPAGHSPTKLQFAVSDTGIGIEPDKLRGLFQPFAQADASTTRRFGGTGLGLAISKRLARLLGGDIEATSEAGRGSTFILTIDTGIIEEVQAPVNVPMAKPTPTVDQSKTNFVGRVLLAEDSPDLQRLLGHVLRKMSIEIEIAENGQLACELAVKSKIEGNPFDLILMDMQMPEMDGLQATRWLREHGWQRPIIAVTAHAMSEHRDDCLAAGCNDYLAKPVQVSELRAMLARYIQRPTEQTACCCSIWVD